MKIKKLTIAIPTYNRNEKLKRTIGLLIPQLISDIKIKIYDNCSDIKVSETLKEFLHYDIEIIRNSVNVGMSGNFIKCFEGCETEWLWLLGDDDPPLEDAIETIMNTVTNNPTCSFINFKTILSKSRNTNFIVSNQDDLISKLDDFGNLLYISVGIYNLKNLKNGYRYLYQYAYTLAPHLAFLFTSLDDKINHNFLFTDKEIINTLIKDTKPTEIWNWLGLSLAIFLLNELAFKVSDENKKKWQYHLKTHIIGPRQVYSEIIRLDPDINNILQDLYWYDQIFLRAKTVMINKDWYDYFLFRLKLILKSKISKIKKRKVMKSSQNLSETIYERF